MGVVGDFEPGRMMGLIEKELGGNWHEAKGSGHSPQSGGAAGDTDSSSSSTPSSKPPDLTPRRVALNSPFLPSALVPVPYEEEPWWWGGMAGDVNGGRREPSTAPGVSPETPVPAASPIGKIFIVDRPGSSQVV